ncbi:MAG TPA: hypothetical protein VHR45_08745 [Thermoanaerobaculia bacterium]|nr:hypothetical protein [Thermoanaerobaculia bacterium]
MRKALIASIALLAVVVFGIAGGAAYAAGSAQAAGPASAGGQAGSAPALAKDAVIVKARGIVTTVDETAKTFSCHWKAKDWTFKTNDKTTYTVGDKPGAWSDLKVKSMVSVTGHDEGSDHVADKVAIRAPRSAGAAPKSN